MIFHTMWDSLGMYNAGWAFKRSGVLSKSAMYFVIFRLLNILHDERSESDISSETLNSDCMLSTLLTHSSSAFHTISTNTNECVLISAPLHSRPRDMSIPTPMQW